MQDDGALLRPIHAPRSRQLLRECAQKRLDAALATSGGMAAECACLPVVDVNARLVKRTLLHEMFIRYRFAGRSFEETFLGNQEVVLPSPTSLYLGDSEV